MCIHFNIEDGRQHTTLSAYYYFKKGKNATETQKKTWATYGEGATLKVTDQTCQKWFAKFLGTIDILYKEFFAVGLYYALKDV